MATSAGVRVVGLNEARRYLQRLESTAATASNAAVLIGSPLNYSYGIETGVRKNGRVARRAGGVFYLSRALARVEPTIPPRVAKYLELGKPAVDALLASGHDVEAIAKQLVVVVTGTLRRSIVTIYSGRPVGISPAGSTRIRRPR